MSAVVESAALALALDGEAVGAAGRRLTSRLGLLARDWQGLAADAAADSAQHVVARSTQVREALDAGAAVLRTCAAGLADADALQRRADLLARHHEDPELLATAQRLRAEAAASRELALHRAALSLRELSAPTTPHRSQVRGFASGLWSVLADTAKQGWDLDPFLIGAHPRAWWSALSGNATGVLHAAQHPTAALSAAAGLDQLREHSYGEWAGTMLGTAVTGFDGGGAARAGGVARRLEREALIVAEDGRWAVRRSSTLGGEVRARRGASLPAGFPSRIRDLTPDRITHILVGDGPGSGGHRPGAGQHGKTEFPADWTDDDIIRSVMDTAMKPSWVSPGRRDNRLCHAWVRGVDVVAVVSPDGAVITGYPLPGGRGVVDNRAGSG
jgi:uncharacterized protein YukE